jgi:tRNA(Ile)-lysidine synthase
MRPRDVDPVQAAVNAALGQVGPGPYGVACSGGGDSLALAHAAMAVAGPTNVAVLSIDHQLQAGSAEVAARVAEWARSQGATGVVRSVEVDRDMASLEDAARLARTVALTEIAVELGLRAVLLGHTLRDQAETVLMRIIRGTGTAGLGAMRLHQTRALEPDRVGCAWVRPLLDLPREQIDEYAVVHSLPVWNDPMNDDPAFFRVRVRTEIMPLLRRENPQIDAALGRLASTTQEWGAAIDELASAYKALPLDCAELATLSPAVRKHALGYAFGKHGMRIEAVHYAALEALIAGPAAGTRSIDVPGGRVVRTYDTLDVERGLDFTESIDVPDGYEARVWVAGDRMKPKRLKGHSKKLSDLFIDGKVALPFRAYARVLVRTSTGEIVWAEHIGLAHGEADELIPRSTGRPRGTDGV